jgi:hypothetical protein
MRKKLLWIAPLAVLGMLIFIWIGGELVMHLWNWLTPGLFGWPRLTFWKALGLLVLCRILFGGFRLVGYGSPRSRIRRRMEERWERMTPEEREQRRHDFASCWEGTKPPDSQPTP